MQLEQRMESTLQSMETVQLSWEAAWDQPTVSFAICKRSYSCSAPERTMLQWVDASKILTPTSSGIYYLSPLLQSTSDYQIIKINAGTTDVFLSYRTATGIDSALGSVGWMDKINVL